MKKLINKKTICLSAAALIMVAAISAGSAMAYFTTFVQARGSVELDLGFTETIPNEKVVNGKKEIILENTGDFDCYVRLKALAGDAHTVAYEEPGNAGKWTPGADGFYYYSDIVTAGGGVSSQINVLIPDLGMGEGEDFNVIIIQECTPVLYDEDGNPYADWTKTADVYKSVVSGEGGN